MRVTVESVRSRCERGDGEEVEGGRQGAKVSGRVGMSSGVAVGARRMERSASRCPPVVPVPSPRVNQSTMARSHSTQGAQAKRAPGARRGWGA